MTILFFYNFNTPHPVNNCMNGVNWWG